MAYYSKKELTNIGLDGFALIDEFYGRGRKGRKPQQQLPNYGGHNATYVVNSRPFPPPAAATPFVAGNRFSTASSNGYSRRHQYQQGYNYYRYSPAESHVGWTPAVAMTAETATVIHGVYEAGDAEMLMDNYKCSCGLVWNRIASPGL